MRIPLNRGFEATIDLRDVPLALGVRWTAVVQARTVYAARMTTVGGRKRRIYLHRRIMEAPLHLVVDHIDGDGLNNRRRNLRLVELNQTSSRIRSGSGYRGVAECLTGWRAYAHKDGRRIHLGTFNCVYYAAAARDAYERDRWARFADLNFPDGVLPDGRPVPNALELADLRRMPAKSSLYRGVCRRPSAWAAYIRNEDGGSRHLGHYDSPIAAALAYDKAAVVRWGNGAPLNFPHGVPILDGGDL